MGGATALRVGESDPRVKCVLTHDPWVAPMNKEITSGTFNGYDKNQSVFLLNTESFLLGPGCNVDHNGQQVFDQFKESLPN